MIHSSATGVSSSTSTSPASSSRRWSIVILAIAMFGFTLVNLYLQIFACRHDHVEPHVHLQRHRAGFSIRWRDTDTDTDNDSDSDSVNSKQHGSDTGGGFNNDTIESRMSQGSSVLSIATSGSTNESSLSLYPSYLRNRTTECYAMQTQYNIRPGRSWGSAVSASHRIEKRWYTLGCDYVQNFISDDDEVPYCSSSSSSSSSSSTRGTGTVRNGGYGNGDGDVRRRGRPERCIISYSIAGSDRIAPDAVEVHGIKQNLHLAQSLYPGWIFRIYVHSTVADDVVVQHDGNDDTGGTSSSSLSSLQWRAFANECRDLVDGVPVEFVSIASGSASTSASTSASLSAATATPLHSLPATLWKLLVVDDCAVDRYIIRNTDTRLTHRESLAVHEWMTTRYGFHSLRDHPNLYHGLNSGLWGARGRGGGRGVDQKQCESGAVQALVMREKKKSSSTSASEPFITSLIQKWVRMVVDDDVAVVSTEGGSSSSRSSTKSYRPLHRYSKVSDRAAHLQTPVIRAALSGRMLSANATTITTIDTIPAMGDNGSNGAGDDDAPSSSFNGTLAFDIETRFLDDMIWPHLASLKKTSPAHIHILSHDSYHCKQYKQTMRIPKQRYANMAYIGQQQYVYLRDKLWWDDAVQPRIHRYYKYYDYQEKEARKIARKRQRRERKNRKKKNDAADADGGGDSGDGSGSSGEIVVPEVKYLRDVECPRYCRGDNWDWLYC